MAVVSRPSDIEDLDYSYRTSKEHVGDLKKVVAAVKQVSSQPVWIIGTSRGTVSTAAAAVAFGNERLHTPNCIKYAYMPYLMGRKRLLRDISGRMGTYRIKRSIMMGCIHPTPR